jgi:hypothetical protein
MRRGSRLRRGRRAELHELVQPRGGEQNFRRLAVDQPRLIPQDDGETVPLGQHRPTLVGLSVWYGQKGQLMDWQGLGGSWVESAPCSAAGGSNARYRTARTGADGTGDADAARATLTAPLLGIATVGRARTGGHPVTRWRWIEASARVTITSSITACAYSPGRGSPPDGRTGRERRLTEHLSQGAHSDSGTVVLDHDRVRHAPRPRARADPPRNRRARTLAPGRLSTPRHSGPARFGGMTGPLECLSKSAGTAARGQGEASVASPVTLLPSRSAGAHPGGWKRPRHEASPRRGRRRSRTRPRPALAAFLPLLGGPGTYAIRLMEERFA